MTSPELREIADKAAELRDRYIAENATSDNHLAYDIATICDLIVRLAVAVDPPDWNE